MNGVIAFVAQSLYVFIVAIEGLFLFLAFRKRWKELLAAGLVIGLIALALAMAANRLVQDPRPFVVSGVQPLICSSTDNGSPSDHALLLCWTSAVLFFANPLAGMVGAIAALLVGVARVYAGVHHLADVFGSLLIVVAASAAYVGLRRLWEGRRRGMPARRDSPS